MNKYKSLAALALALLFLGACSSSNGGGIFGGNPSSNSSYDIRGTVDSVDTSTRSIYLTNVSGYNSMLSSGGSSTVRVYYDDRTTVNYQGKSYRPEDLERGDQVSANVAESGNRLLADAMTVTYNANGTSTSSPSYPSSSYPTSASVRGTVLSVDTSRNTIQVDRGYGSTVTVEYNTSTPVYWNNQTYRAADLERGDEIDVRAQDYGSGRFVAQDITVTRNVSSGGTSSSSSSQLSTVRGTVRYIDTSRHTIELGSTSWISGFTGGNSGAGTIVVQYDPSLSVDVQGRLYPVTNLEVGDVIDVQVNSLGGSTYRASRISLVRDVNQR